MKKYFFILLLMMIIIPFNTQALSIAATSITSSKEEMVGNNFFVTINIGFNGLDKKSIRSDGIGAIMYQIDFDESILSITDVITDFYDSAIYKDDDGYYIMSIVDDDSTGNKCIDGVLACSDYEAKVYFYVKDTDEEVTNVQLKNIGVGYYPVDENAYYEEDDVKEAEATSNKVTTIKIKQSDKEIEIEPESKVIMENKPSIESNKVFSTIHSDNDSQKSNSKSSEDTTADEKSLVENSSNSYLKTLSIKDSFIDFKKEEYSYIIRVPQTCNKLDIIVETDDEEATFQIVGADDLKKYNDVVKINVTSQDGHKSVYVVHIKREKLSDKEANQIINRLNIGTIAISGSVFVLLIIAKIVSLLNRRKLNKLAK